MIAPRSILAALTLAWICWLLPAATGQSAALVDTSHSPHAAIHGVGIDEVRWTGGFWADRVATCQQKSIPAMWALMRDGTYKPFLEHFLIAAGQAEGDYHGAQWNDGDFYKWLEGAIVTWSATKDDKLGQAIETSIRAITAAQREDGYLHTPVLIRQRNGDTAARPFEDRFGFEMYNMGHLITTACVHYRLTHDRRLLDAAEKAAEFLDAAFTNPTPELACNNVCPSHYMALVELYRTTGKQQYLQLAQKLLDLRKLASDGGDDNQDRIPLAEQREIVGHAVRANYLYAGAADLVAETGDQSLLTTLQAVWDNLTEKKLYITGACGALYDGASPDGSPDQSQITRVHQAYGRNYQLPNTTAHNETCANIAGAMWNWRMFLITGEAKYVDLLETALYNSILSGVSLSGTEYFYVNPLRVVDPLPVELRFPRTRQPFFTSFCCPPNLVRTLAEVGSYAYSKTDDAVWVNLYGSNTLATTLSGKPLKLTQTTAYPWDSVVKIKIDACPTSEFALKLRIPSWCSRASIKVNGTPQIAAATVAGYFELRRVWQAGDMVELTLPLDPQLIAANPLAEEVTHQVAVRRGPVVYCVESTDLPSGVKLDSVAISADAKLTAHYEPNLLGGVGVVELPTVAQQSKPWDRELYRPLEPSNDRQFKLRLVPYYAWANRGPGEMSVWLPVR